MKIGLVQLSVGPDPKENLPITLGYIRDCASLGAEWVFTPEVTNALETDHVRQKEIFTPEAEDETLRALSDLASELGIWLSVGSIAVKSGDPDGRFVNRGFMIAPDGTIAARYDKIHMFDVTLSETESFRESARYRPGGRAVVANGPMKTGMSICYDVRFGDLYRRLAQAGAELLVVPAAFAQTTGKAHWHVLLRARAIETGCFVVAAAQTGEHGSDGHALRKTFGHSLVVNPWGEVLLDMETAPGAAVVDIDQREVAKARGRVPAILTEQDYDAP